MSCPRCGAVQAVGCQCTFADSNCITVAASGNTRTPTVRLDPAITNVLSCGASGLLAVMSDRFTIPTIRKVRSASTTFNNNDAITFPTLEYDYVADSMSFSTSEVEIPFDAKYRVTAYANFDNNDGNYNSIRLEIDTGGGYAIISATRESRDTTVTHESFINLTDEFDLDAGDKIRVTVGENATGAVTILKASLVVSFASL